MAIILYVLEFLHLIWSCMIIMNASRIKHNQVHLLQWILYVKAPSVGGKSLKRLGSEGYKIGLGLMTEC